METHLKINHLAPYLPYGLNIKTFDKKGDIIKKADGIYKQYDNGDFMLYWNYNEGSSIQSANNIKPILRPLSDIFNGKYEDILDEFSEQSLEAFKISFLSELRPLNALDNINYTIATKLFKNHFDVFGLIEKDLAIDINTL